MKENYENGMTNKMNLKTKLSFDGDINNKIENKYNLHLPPQFHSMMCTNYIKAGVNNNKLL